MNNSIFNTTDDPWENGWASSDVPAASDNLYANSGYLTSSQLLGSNSGINTPLEDDGQTPSGQSIPESYKFIHSKISGKINTVNDLQVHIFDRLTRETFLSNFQVTRIIDVLYDNNILPPSIESNFWQILGLIALEIDAPGSGDYITLKFRFNTSLPELPQTVVNLLVSDEESEAEKEPDFVDPLTAQLASSNLSENGGIEWDNASNNTASAIKSNKELLVDPVLADHSSIQQQNEGDSYQKSIPIDDSQINKYINEIRDKFKPLMETNESVRIKEVPEKEGLLFKHINYIILHDLPLGMHGPSGTKKVTRRYSDFVWLLDYLLKKYPFRIIPGLPPKKFNVGSSPDSQFLQRRRRGLHRFLNQLVKHPVLRQEPVVVTFLSVPTDLTTWKKQARIDFSLEFKGQKISTNFINSIWPTIGEEFLACWKKCEDNIGKTIEIWTKIVVLVERYEKRQQQISFDNGKFVEMINKFSDLDDNLYPHKPIENKNNILVNNNKDDVNAINDSLNYISEFFNKASQILVDESYTTNTTILEKFKNYLDYLYSLQELFERSKKLSVNTIPQLQKKIQENELRYNKANTEDVDIKGSELIKLRQIIINDKQEIFQQLNKDWLIKNCCFEEFICFQETQYLISEIWTEWCKGRFKFQDKYAGLYDNLNNEIMNDMPLTR